MREIELSKAQARRFMLRRLGLVGEYQFSGKQGAADYIRHVGAVQIDPIDVCGRSHQNTLHAHVRGFQKPMLDRLLYKDRQFFEYHDKCFCIIPAECWPHFAQKRAYFAGWERSAQVLAAAGQAARDQLAQKGPLPPAGLEIPGHTHQWPHWHNLGAPLASAVMDVLYYTGEVTVHHRQGNQRYYHLAGACLPAPLATAPDPFSGDAQAFYEWLVLRRVGASALLPCRASDAWLDMYGFTAAIRDAAFHSLKAAGKLIQVNVEGLAYPLHALAGDAPLLQEVAAGARYRARCEIIAPLDSVIWDRRLVADLFGFAYKWEVYTPAAKRRFGHYVMPVLWGERFVARVQLARKGPALCVQDIWLEPGVRRTGRLDAALQRCLARFARFHACEGITGYEAAFRPWPAEK